MNKLKMAHDYAIEMLKRGDPERSIALDAWTLADAMQAEADKREVSGFPNVLRGACGEIVAVKVDDKEWQPDWSQAPEWANWWAMDENRDCYWHSCVDSPFIGNGVFEAGDSKGHTYDAPSFNYQGNWQDSLRKRPQ